MTKEQNVRAILECNFAGFREDLIDIAVDRIMDLTESNEKCENIPDDPIAEYKREYNFHRECLERIINRMDDSETFSAVDFYVSEATSILLKMRDCKYTNLGGREP